MFDKRAAFRAVAGARVTWSAPPRRSADPDAGLAPIVLEIVVVVSAVETRVHIRALQPFQTN